MKTRIQKVHSITALAALACLASQPTLRANDWIASEGDWSNPVNWDFGVPDNAGGWAIGNIGNGGTAWVTTAVPRVSEAWAGDNGVAGTIIVTNGGTLTVDNWLVVGRTGAGGNTPLSTLIVAGTGIINKGGDGFLIGDGTFCSGQMIVKDNAQVNLTGGWNGIGNGDGGEGWLTLQDNAVYNASARDWNIGDWGSGRGHAYIRDNATLNVSRFWVGKGGTTVGAVWQTGGTVHGTGGSPTEWCIGGTDSGAADSFGFWQITGGVFVNPFNIHIGRWGKGLFYQTGGTVTLGGWSAVGREVNGVGIVYITGGQFSHTNAGGPALMVAEQPSRGEMTLAGTGVVTCANRLVIGNGGTAYVNLNGGTLRAPQIVRWNGSSYLNFSGGTLQATMDNPAFLDGLTEARIYAGNAIIDTDGHNITIQQALLDGTGQGVTAIPVATGGAGYMAPPVVQITGDGFGALAVAEIDPVAGTVTNIVVTCPGYAYNWASADLIGGGPSTVATVGTPTVDVVAGGGLIKNGAGTLTLASANMYTGPTVVNAGQLHVTTDSFGMGAYTVADQAGVGVKMSTAGAQLLVASLSLAGGGAATLDFDLGNFGNPFAAPLRVAGNLALNGTVTVNIADDFPQPGQFALLQYTTRSGAGAFVLGTLPSGVQAELVDNTLSQTIDLRITSVGLPRWDGQVSDRWDISTTTNWVELSTGLPTIYKDLAPALFNDDALGTTAVNLVTDVSPSGVTVNNTLRDYVLFGTGRMGGTFGLTKQGSGTLTLANTNNYTGPTAIRGGTVIVTNLANGGQPSAIGSASVAASNLVLASGTLRYAGPAVAIDRGYSIAATNSTIETLADLALGGPVTAEAGSGFVKTGPARLTYSGVGIRELSGGAFPGYAVTDGTVVFDGRNGAQTNHNQGELWVGNTPTTGASLVLSNTTLNVDSWFAIGRGNGSVGNLSTATLHDSRLRSGNLAMGYDAGLLGNLAHSVLTLHGSSAITNIDQVNIGESGGSLAELYMNNTSKLFTDGRMFVGWRGGATGAVTLAQSAELAVDAWFSVGHEGGVGTVTLKDDSRCWVLWDLNVTDVDLGEGTFNLQDNATATANNFFIGKGVGSTGRFNQTGGSAIGLPSGNEFQIGFHGTGTWDLSAGSIVAPNHWFIVGRWSDGPGTLNVTGGTIIHGTNNAGRLFRVGEDGTGGLNLSGTGVIETACNEVTVGWNATGNGTVNLNGGIFQARRIIGGSGTSAFNFNGGVLRAGPNANADFMTSLTTAYVLGGGAIIDTGGNNIGIAQALLDTGTGGGLTKLGAGALYLNGANTYTGPTLVNAGTLGGSGAIYGPVTVAANGTLAPGTSIGTLTMFNALTLNGTTLMEISKEGGAVASDLAAVSGLLTYGGTLNVVLTGTNTLAEDDVFNLFDWGSRSGTFAAMNLPTGYTWDVSQLSVDGTIRVTGIQQPPPTVDPPTIAGGNLVLKGAGGTAGAGYTWLSSTNVAAPMAEWITNLTGVFDAAGGFSNAVPVNSEGPEHFFRLRVP